MNRAFVWSAAGSALSIVLYAVFIAGVGVGAGSDAYFAGLGIAQALAGLLYAPYEAFAQRFALDRLRNGVRPAPPLVVSYLALSGIALVPYYLWGEALLGPLFGPAYAADPALWRYHFRVLGALVPLTGAVTMMQVCCQARERYVLPKVGIVMSRIIAIGLLVAAGESRLRAMSVVVVVAQAVAAGVGAAGVGGWRMRPRALVGETRAALREWMHVNRWTMILKTDVLLERVLAARVTTGFLSLYHIGWSGVVGLVEAFHAAFVVADSNRYHAAGRGARIGGLRALIDGPYRASRAAGVRITGLAAGIAGAVAVAALATGWAPGGVRPAEVALLVVTLVAAQLAQFLWKQLAGAYTIQHRAVEFARGLTLVYLVFVFPRILLTWQLGAVGFCVGLVAYYWTQVGVVGRRA